MRREETGVSSVITGGVRTATICVSLFLGFVVSLLISLNEFKQAVNGAEGWSSFAPGWKIFDPGPHDGFMLLATLFDAGLYSVIIFAAFYGFVKLVDKRTQ